jgi:hypothetical protein
MRRRALELSLVFLLAACRATPELGGASLLCERAADCPDGLRCISGGCVANTPPTLAPLGVHFADVGGALDLDADVHDEDGDALTVTWSQVLGPPLSLPSAGANARLLFPEQGVYVVEVHADDGFGGTSSTSLSVFALPAPPPDTPVYVSDLGADAPTCGALADPCATIAGARSARAHEDDPIVLAAPSRPTPYSHCLKLSTGESLWGGLDGAWWRYDPALVARTEVVCPLDESPGLWPGIAGVGHEVGGTAFVGHLTLKMGDGAAACTGVDAVTTVLVSGESFAPRFWHVDIEAAPAPSPCTAFGLISENASPSLDGVDVRGSSEAFDVTALYGMYLVGGQPQIRGGDGRGVISLDAPTQYGATGILLGESLGGRIDGVTVEGGVAAVLIGIELVGGTSVVENTQVTLRPFGSFVMFGIGAFPCLFGDDDACANHPSPATTTLRHNTVSLRGAAGSFVSPPCVGIGVGVVNQFGDYAHRPTPSQVTDNEITVTDGFSTSLGIFASGGGVHLADNRVTSLASPLDNAGCVDFGAAFLGGAGIEQATVGLGVQFGEGDTIEDNTLSIGPHRRASVGMFLRNSHALQVRQNTIDVAVADGPFTGDAAYGVILSDNSNLVASSFYRNVVTVRAAAVSGTGMTIRGTAPWHIDNNLVFGGLCDYSTGVALFGGSETPPLPILAHNTIHGGGDGDRGRVSRAVVLAESVEDTTPTPMATVIGRWVNNLLDAGSAVGRRLLIDHDDRLFPGFDGTNAVQHWGDSLAADPPIAGLVFPDPKGLFLTQAVNVLTPRAGAINTVDVALDVLVSNERWAPARGAFERAWVGDPEDALSAFAIIVTTAPGVIAVGSSVWGEPLALSSYPTTTFIDGLGDVELSPASVTVGEIDGAPGEDIVFTVAAGTGNPATGLWWRSALGEGDLVRAELTLEQPDLVVVSRFEDDAAHRFYVVDNGAHAILEYPDDPAVSISDLPAGTITAAIAGRMTTTDGATQLPVLAIAAGPALAVWNASSLASGPIPFDAGAPAPCAGEAVTALDLLAHDCTGATDSTCWYLLAGCADGEIESYGYDGSQLVQRFAGSPSNAAPVTFLAGGYGRIVVGHAGTGGFELFTVPPNPAGRLSAPSSVSLLADVGRRAATTGLYLGPDALDPIPELVEGTCGLQLREATPGTSLDLHLSTTNPGTCSDQGASTDDIYGPGTSIAADVDGESRDASTPDIGADEL